MSLNFGASGSVVTFGIGGVANASNGAVTLITLWKPNFGGTTNSGLLAVQSSTTERRSLTIDSSALFGDQDFSSGFPFTGSAGDWLWLALTKPAGSSTFRMHWKNYSTGGSWSHGVSVGAGSHTDPGVSNLINVGANATASTANGDVAVSAIALANFADLTVEAACTAALRDLANAGIGWGVRFMNSSPTSIQDFIGSGHETSRTGTITNSADPPGFDFSLGSSIDPVMMPIRPPDFGGPGFRPQPIYDYNPAAAAITASGAAATTQRHTTSSSTAKGGSGASSNTGRAAVTASGRKGGVGSSTTAARPVENSAGSKTAIGTASTIQRQNTRATTSPSATTQTNIRTATTAAGAKTALTTGTTQQRATTAASGIAKKTGIAAAAQRAALVAVGKKTSTGATSIQARHQTTSTGSEVAPFAPVLYGIEGSTTGTTTENVTTGSPSIGAASSGSGTLD